MRHHADADIAQIDLQAFSHFYGLVTAGQIDERRRAAFASLHRDASGDEGTDALPAEANLLREHREALAPILRAASAKGVSTRHGGVLDVDNIHLDATAYDPRHTITNALIDESLRPPLARFATRAMRAIGLGRRSGEDAPSVPTGPYVCVSISLTARGPQTALREMEEAIRSEMSRIRKPTTFKSSYRLPAELDADDARALEWQRRREEGPTGVPTAGLALEACLADLSDRLKEGSHDAFAVCERLIDLLRRNRDLLAVVAPAARGLSPKPQIKPTDALKNLEGNIRSLAKNKDLDGLTDLFFEFSPQGVFYTLRDEMGALASETKWIMGKAEAAAKVFGDGMNGFLVLQRLEKRDLPVPRRIREIEARRADARAQPLPAPSDPDERTFRSAADMLAYVKELESDGREVEIGILEEADRTMRLDLGGEAVTVHFEHEMLRESFARAIGGGDDHLADDEAAPGGPGPAP